MRTHNHLLKTIDGCDGFKTGYFKAAGFSIVATAKRNGVRIIAIVLGSKDSSRKVASKAAEKTGLDVGILKKMLPMVASMAMGALSKQGAKSGVVGRGAQPQQTSGAQSLFTSLLDSDGDGSVMDDLMGFAKKLF